MVKMKYLICEYCGMGIASSTGKIPKELRLEFASDHIDCEINHPKKKRGDVMRQSARFTLNAEDLRKWGFNIVRFVLIPTVIAFLTALQGGVDMRVAWGVAIGTGYTSVVDLFRKFIAK